MQSRKERTKMHMKENSNSSRSGTQITQHKIIFEVVTHPIAS